MDESEKSARLDAILERGGGDTRTIAETLLRDRDAQNEFLKDTVKHTFEEFRAESKRKTRIIAFLIAVIVLQFLLLAGAAAWFFGNFEVVDEWHFEQSWEWHGGDGEFSGDAGNSIDN